jgi:hypothetical protein
MGMRDNIQPKEFARENPISSYEEIGFSLANS